jgi:TM2 domain-containing membrane protein YozV
MICKNCGNQMDNNAVFCVKCGVSTGQGSSFCPNCGGPTVPGAAVCTQCGVALGYGGAAPVAPGTEQKSKLAAGLLGILVGTFGAHNFYLGNTGKAVAQLLITVLSCGFLSPVSAIWGLVEGIQILTGSINKDAKGIPLKD